MIEIKNDKLAVKIFSKGAEIQSVYDLNRPYEYLWQGTPPFWNGRAPVLFPIVGALKEHKYRFDNKVYKMQQHGFARSHTFQVVSAENNAARFELSATDETKSFYPFDFIFAIEYTLKGYSLEVKYYVKNAGVDPMWFSIGGHPAFNMPYPCILEFEAEEHLESTCIDVETCLVSREKKEIAKAAREIELMPEVFNNGALIFSGLESKKVSLFAPDTGRKVTMSYDSIETLGIWSDKGPFVCLEPWWGIADYDDSTQEFSKKDQIKRLETLESFNCGYVLSFN